MPVHPRSTVIHQTAQPARRLTSTAAVFTVILFGSMLQPAAAQQSTSRPATPDPAQLEFGERLVMQRCANCHAIAKDEEKYAAPLHHLFGRKAGSLEGYTYSPVIKNLNIPWSPSTLDNWLRQTTFDTPDIRMRHVGIPKEDQRAAVITFLKSLPGNETSQQ
ncbi:MAG: c-type cytochrome [Alphaproteobacteria bacterium]|nr:c-type cytochrome [Alphaproteobacteria bacterium]